MKISDERLADLMANRIVPHVTRQEIESLIADGLRSRALLTELRSLAERMPEALLHELTRPNGERLRLCNESVENPWPELMELGCSYSRTPLMSLYEVRCLLASHGAQQTQKQPHPLSGFGYVMSESGLGKYRLIIGYETLSDLHRAQEYVVTKVEG